MNTEENESANTPKRTLHDQANQSKNVKVATNADKKALVPTKPSKKEKNIEDIMRHKEKGLLVISLNGTIQYRLGGVLDIYPTNSKYFHVKKNKWGSFDSMDSIIKKYLPYRRK